MLPLENRSVLLISSRGWKNQAKMVVTIFVSIIRLGEDWSFPIAMEETDPLAAPAEASKEGSDGGKP